MITILNFKDKETFRKLERQAYDGNIDVSSFPPAEYKYFSELKKIYYDFKFEELSKEEAALKKQLQFNLYRDALAEAEHRRKVYAEYQDNIRIAITDLSRIEKSHNLVEIALLACDVIGRLTGEVDFYDRQKRKIMEGKNER